MLGQADRDLRIDYLVCPAEALPLANVAFDLLTVSSALHWFERNAFLAEARRVLKPRGWLVIYDSFFSANLKGNPGFQSLVRVHLLPTLPCATSRQPPSRRSVCQTSRLRIGQGREVLQRRLLRPKAADRLPAHSDQRHRSNRSRRIDARRRQGLSHHRNQPILLGIRATSLRLWRTDHLPAQSQLARHHAPRDVLQRRPLAVHQQVGPE